MGCAMGLWVVVGGCVGRGEERGVVEVSSVGTGEKKEYQRRAPRLPGGVATKRKSEPVVMAPTAQAGVPRVAEAPGGSREAAVVATRGWSILLARCVDEREAEVAAGWARSVAGVAGAFVEVRKGAALVLVGDYAGPGSPEAKRELARIRELEVGGERPFAGAALAPPVTTAAAGSRPEWDLAEARRGRGKGAVYTLQVGVYERGAEPTGRELAEVRRAAEEAVASLRAGGEEAYYYHGPRRSTVTVGLFAAEDLERKGAGQGESAALKVARSRHPNNLVNGQGVRVRGADGAWRLQASVLVEVPRE